MTRFDRPAIALLAVALLLSFGCHKKEASKQDQLAAAEAASDAQFAMTIREYPRAQAGYKKATDLMPENGDYWLGAGIAAFKAGDKSAAKSAYKSAANAYKAAYKKDKTALGAANQYVFVEFLLHEPADAKDFLIQVAKDHPENTGLNTFVNSNQLDKMADDPHVKDLAL